MTNFWKQKIQDVGRNKSARRQQGRAFPAIGAPETPVLRLTRGLAYSGLLRDFHLVPTLRVGMQTGAKPVYTCFTNPEHFLSRLTNDCRFLVLYAFPRGSVGTRNNGKDRARGRVIASVRVSHA